MGISFDMLLYLTMFGFLIFGWKRISQIKKQEKNYAERGFESISLKYHVVTTQNYMVLFMIMLFLSIYLIARIARHGFSSDLTNESTIMLAVLLSIISFMMWQIDKKKKKIIFRCPYCGSRNLLKNMWKCQHCDTVQAEEKLLSDPCDQCKTPQNTAFCKQCNEEFSL